MQNRIFFLSPDNKSATGGIKQLYRQVDVLNNNGFEAYILHKKLGHRSVWFENNTKICYNSSIFNDLKFIMKNDQNYGGFKQLKLNLKRKINLLKSKILKRWEVQFRETDLLVFPEVYGYAVKRIEAKLSKVIFNQNCYYSFENFNNNISTAQIPYDNNTLKFTIVASQDALEYLNYSFKGLQVHRIRLGIDNNVFNFSENKKKQIAYMPRKLSEDLVQVLNILKFKNIVNDWNLIAIDNKSESEVASILKESLIFLSFNHREGFGLPPAEAMACGCFVIGYAGRGGEEYFKPEFSSKIEDRNIILFVKSVESTISEYNLNPENIIQKGKKASEFILSEYCMKNEEKDSIDLWKNYI